MLDANTVDKISENKFRIRSFSKITSMGIHMDSRENRRRFSPASVIKVTNPGYISSGGKFLYGFETNGFA